LPEIDPVGGIAKDLIGLFVRRDTLGGLFRKKKKKRVFPISKGEKRKVEQRGGGDLYPKRNRGKRVSGRNIPYLGSGIFIKGEEGNS